MEKNKWQLFLKLVFYKLSICLNAHKSIFKFKIYCLEHVEIFYNIFKLQDFFN